MDAFIERLIVRAATLDELLSDDFEPMQGQKTDADRAALRLAAWCRSCASGDWQQFRRRLERDGWDFPSVLERFASVRPTSSAPRPAWIDDAVWIDAALRTPSSPPPHADVDPFAFEHLWTPLVESAETRLWAGVDPRTVGVFTDFARASLRNSLLKQLSELCAPVIYEVFDTERNTATPVSYQKFVADMKTDGFRRLFEAKPVLLRVIATLTRQWIDATSELVARLGIDLDAIRAGLLDAADSRVALIQCQLSDQHNGGRSVHILAFEDGTRVVYKPKDLRVDVALHSLIDDLNDAGPPQILKPVRALSRAGYGWTEFIEHTPCSVPADFESFFARAGAWLALFYCLAAADMHQANIISHGGQPVPIDVETILQADLQNPEALDPESQAWYAGMKIVADSAMTVDMIPSYERSPENQIFAIGGLISDWNTKVVIHWDGINTDAMRPQRFKETDTATANLPHIAGRYARFADYLETFVAAFEAYATFLARWKTNATTAGFLERFAGLPVRYIARPTRFYSLLVNRLYDHQKMDDGIIWSVQADFVARLMNWSEETDTMWPLLRAERTALLEFNVPYFVIPSDNTRIHDNKGMSLATSGTSGLERAVNRVRNLDESEIDWQVTVIRENIESFRGPVETSSSSADSGSHEDGVPTGELFLAEADSIARELSSTAIRRGPGAAWIALDWPGDSEAFQLICLGPELYNGVSGIAVFLAAHAAVTGCAQSGELALASVAQLRKQLNGGNASRMARSWGIGGGTGLGSVVYALAVMADSLHDDGLLADAHRAAALVTDELIGADTQFDALGGSAGAILGLLRLHRDSPSDDVLARATRCGEHLLSTPRVGPYGRRTWGGQGIRRQGINGMSHGAAGYAYALASLAAATGREEFAEAATECVAFENSSYDPRRQTWPDLRFDGQTYWPCQWCHGAPGIGLGRIAMARLQGADTMTLEPDIQKAAKAVNIGWPGQQRDTLCCGSLGSIEFLNEAATELHRDDLREQASRRLAGVLSAAAERRDYRWNAGSRRFNPGLFRGLAGVGYTILRQIDSSLPNILFWE